MKVENPIECKEVNKHIDEDEYDSFSIFLAGTIDNGDSNNWQEQLIEKIKDKMPSNFTVYNPRRENWNKNATIKELQYQIAWEQQHLHISDLIIMVLLDNSQSPISLMELGEFCSSGKMVVFCTKKFYRYWNVKDLCLRKGIYMYETNNIDKIAESVVEVVNYNIN
jgi:hypothetical protein